MLYSTFIFRLAAEWCADVVLAMSSLITLADNQPPHALEWEIPMVVRDATGIKILITVQIQTQIYVMYFL